jgi:hypothetical protein
MLKASIISLSVEEQLFLKKPIVKSADEELREVFASYKEQKIAEGKKAGENGP